MDISSWDKYNYTIFVFLCHFGLQCILFEVLLQFSILSPYTKVKLGNIFDTRVQYCLWGEGITITEKEKLYLLQRSSRQRKGRRLRPTKIFF